MTTHDAQFTAQNVEAADRKSGPQAALNILEQQYANFAYTHGGHQSSEVLNYWQQITQQLDKDHVLPNLAIAWGSEHMNTYTQDGYSKSDLKQIMQMAPSPLDRSMAKSLFVQYEPLKNVHRDGEGGFLGIGEHERDAITAGDFKDALNNLANQKEARSFITPLMATRDGDPSHTLFAQIDAAPGGKVDGKIGKGDLENFLESYNYQKNSGQLDGLLPLERDQMEKNAQFVSWLDQNWDTDPRVLKLRGVDFIKRDSDRGTEEPVYNRYLTLENLSRSGGFRNTVDMVASNRTILPPRVDAREDKEQSAPRQDVRGEADGKTTDAKKQCLDMRNRAIMDQLFSTSTQRAGEGPYQAAARLLPGASVSDIMQLTRLLKSSYQAATGDNTDRLAKLSPGYQWINQYNAAAIIKNCPALQRRLSTTG